MCCEISVYATQKFKKKYEKRGWFYGYKKLNIAGSALIGNYKYSAGEARISPISISDYDVETKGFHFYTKNIWRHSTGVIKVIVKVKDLIGVSTNYTDYGSEELGQYKEGVANAITIQKKEWQNFLKRTRSRRAKCVAI